MKRLPYFLTWILILSIGLSACKSMSKSQKGAVIGAAGGAAAGAVVGKLAGNTVLGAIIGAAVGGVAGAIIGRQMDKQAEEIKKEIPDAKVVRVGEGIVVEFNNKILFGFDRSDLTPESLKTMNQLVAILKKYPDTNIEIQGHTDSRGSAKYNQSLSVRRASAVSIHLSDHGVVPSRLVLQGFGESAPKYSNDTDEGRALNRRVEFLIYANEKMIEDAKKEAAKSGEK